MRIQQQRSGTPPPAGNAKGVRRKQLPCRVRSLLYPSQHRQALIGSSRSQGPLPALSGDAVWSLQLPLDTDGQGVDRRPPPSPRPARTSVLQPQAGLRPLQASGGSAQAWMQLLTEVLLDQLQVLRIEGATLAQLGLQDAGFWNGEGRKGDGCREGREFLPARVPRDLQDRKWGGPGGSSAGRESCQNSTASSH